MEILGRIINGVVVFEGSPSLPEGAAVIVTLQPKSPVIRVPQKQRRVEFPLVESTHPHTVHLTNEMIGEILDDEDAASGG